jgi:osmoprotectant transport system ATP-binding protein
MLSLRNVEKSFGDFQAVAPLSIDFAAGQTAALLGSSGCGKSTLLRMIVGLIEPDRGEIVFDGTPVTRENLQDFRRRTGYVIQDGGLFPHLTVERNVTLMARQLRWPQAKIDERLETLLALTQMPPDMLKRYPLQISGGQRQRVSLMRALFLDPDLILLDEPMGALDPLIRSELQNQLREIFDLLKKTVLLVTHDIAEAGFLAQRLILLKGGRVQQDGDLRDLAERPANDFVPSFLNAQRSPLESLAETAS